MCSDSFQNFAYDTIINILSQTGGRNSSVSSVLGLLSCMTHYRWFNQRTTAGPCHPVEGIFFLELLWVLTPVPKTLLDESINLDPSYGLKKSLHSSISCPRWANEGNTNTSSMHHPHRLNVTTSRLDLKPVTYAKISPKMVNPRDIAGNGEEEYHKMTVSRTERPTLQAE